MFFREDEECHNHRFAGVTGEATPYRGSRIHRLITRTDFADEYFPVIRDVTGPAIRVGKGKHVHFVSGRTSFNDGHRHGYQFATLIEDPTGRENRKSYEDDYREYRKPYEDDCDFQDNKNKMPKYDYEDYYCC
jgi:hypothetical protein